MASQILVVEDDPWIRRMVCDELVRRGHRVRAVSNGREALARVAEFVPDLVVTDILMPEMDGWRLAASLRAQAELAQVPILFLSAEQSAPEPEGLEVVREGDGFLAKPFRLIDLAERVARMLAPLGAAPAVPPVVAQGTPPHTGRHAAIAPPPRAPAASAAPPEPAPPMPYGSTASGPTGFQGQLEHVGLASLLTMTQLERSSGILVLRRDHETARLFFRSGRPVAARIMNDARRGAEAIYYLLTWNVGQFGFSRIDVEMEDEIGLSSEELILEGARRIDEGPR